MKLDNQKPVQPSSTYEQQRDNKSGLLKTIGITAATIIPALAVPAYLGCLDAKYGAPVFGSTFFRISSQLPAAVWSAANIPFRFDNMDPGCLAFIGASTFFYSLQSIIYTVAYNYTKTQ